MCLRRPNPPLASATFSGLGSVRAGFSLIEVIVATVIIAVLASLIAPRFSNVASRRALASVNELGELISAAAVRDGITGQAVALEFDAPAGRLTLLTPTSDDQRRALGAWRADPLSRPVDLDGVSIESATLDRQELDPAHFRVEFPRTEARARLVVVLKQDAGESRWAVVLSPTGTRAQVMAPEDAFRDDDVIDLDATGQGGGVW
jgi:prepilin-type N-terminal cleavage/methylation domain-containing protein